MDAEAIISAIEGVIKLAAEAYAAEQEIQPYAEAIYSSLVKKTATSQADLDALDAEVEAVHAAISAPLPPEQA